MILVHRHLLILLLNGLATACAVSRMHCSCTSGPSCTWQCASEAEAPAMAGLVA